jgi:multimeric flavodoxin WrbA
MNILILAGSARPKGTSILLAEEFKRGAEEAGAAVDVFHAGTAKIHGCLGCGHCEHGKNPCVFHDDMELLYPKFLAAQIIVMATPIYNWGITSQLKAVFDRWQPIVFDVQEKKKAVLLTTQAGQDDWITEPVNVWYQALVRFMEWQSVGRLAAVGVMERADIEATDYPSQAYELGKQVGETF